MFYFLTYYIYYKNVCKAVLWMWRKLSILIPVEILWNIQNLNWNKILFSYGQMDIYIYIYIYINICKVSKTPVGSQGCFQKMVIIKLYIKSTKEHPLGRVVSINEGRKSVFWSFMILNYLHPFLFFIQILCKAKL